MYLSDIFYETEELKQIDAMPDEENVKNFKIRNALKYYI